LKDSPLQKYYCLGSKAPAYIISVEQNNDAGVAIAEQFACLPTSSVPKKQFGTFRILKRNVHVLLG